MNPTIVHINLRKFIGLSLSMSVLENRTAELWRTMGPRIKEIRGRVSEDRISLQVYPHGYFYAFDPSRKFEKWALVEVSSFEHVPPGLFEFKLPGGSYAVFDYKGLPGAPGVFQEIYGRWLPGSDYALDERPHFEVLGPKYRNADPESEEEIWIPIR